MPKCVVPNCKIKCSEKRSLFGVPKDVDQYKQWVAAIPGIAKLKPTHVVCDKHFDEADVIREWIKRDSNGRIIAQEPYKKPKLRKLAVPSKFDDLSTTKNCAVQFTEYLQWSIPGESAGFSDSVQLIGRLIKESSAETTTIYSSALPIVDGAKLVSPMELVDTDPPVTVPVALADTDPLVTVPVTLTDTDPLVTVPVALADIDSLMTVPVAFVDTDPLVTVPVALADTDPLVTVPVALADTDPLVTVPVALADTDPLVTAPVALEELITICSSVTTRKYVESETGLTYQEISTKLPEYWSVGKVPATNGQSIVFTYVITRVENGKRLPVAQKCVTLDSDRKLQFCVYGRDVDSQKANLDETLEGIETLPNVLTKFKGMNVCSGLGEVNIGHLPAGTVFQDGIQQWRSKDCSLLFEKRRCDSCTKMRKRVQQTAWHKNRPTLNRISGASNSIDRRNSVALRVKCRRQKCKKIRAKEREKHLMNCLKKQKEQIANMQRASLDEKCSALNIPVAQQLALNRSRNEQKRRQRPTLKRRR